MTTTIYVKTRFELTETLKEYTEKGYTCFRVRAKCLCVERGNKRAVNQEQYTKSSLRNGVLVLDRNRVYFLCVRCKFCGKSF